MTSPSRRKRQITVRIRTANRANYRFVGKYALLASCIAVILLPASLSDAQQRTVEGFQQSRYAPPVHIPPRKTLYDPGLPKSLNGKFNATQQIRGTAPFQGQRAVIGDVSDEPIQYQTRRPAGGLQQKITQLVAPLTSKTRQQRAAHPHQSQPPTTQQRKSVLSQGKPQQPETFRPQAQTATPNRHRPQPSRLQNRLQKSMSAVIDNYRNLTPHTNKTGQANRIPTPSTRVASRRQPSLASQAGDQRSHSANRSTNGRQIDPHARIANQIRSRERNIPSEIEAGPQKPILRTAAQEQIHGFTNELTLQMNSASENGLNQVTTTSSIDVSQQSQQKIYAGAEESIPNARSNPNAEPISVMTQPKGNLNLNSGSIANTFESSPEFESTMDYVPTGNALRESARSPGMLRRYQDDDPMSEMDEDADGNDEQNDTIAKKSCEQFRNQLLNRPITDIALDISPPARTDILGTNPFRVWRDRNGNELAQGTISDIRRGYVIVDSSNGGKIRLPYARLSETDWQAISEYWVLPEACGLGSSVFAGRNWMPQTVNWHASALCHKPLYFENIQLERYGHSAGPVLQPILSTGHFFDRVFFFPYTTAINPPNECQYALGFYRPGDCAPWLTPPIPISLSGASRQSFWFTGFGFLTQ